MGPSQKKVLPKRAHGNIHLPEWAFTEAVKTGPLPKETAAKVGPRQHPTTGAALLKLPRRTLPKRNAD